MASTSEHCVNVDSCDQSRKIPTEQRFPISDRLDAASENSETKQLSKRQQKRQAKIAKFKENRKAKRVIEKAKKKEKRALQKAQGILKKPVPKRTMAESKCKIRVIVDMAYEDKMDERLIRNTLSQLNYCYAANRRAENPLQYYIVNLNGFTRDIFRLSPDFEKWDVFRMYDFLEDVFPKDEIVYLCAESENVLEDLDPQKAYVIGGLIDHNKYKGLCHRRAIEKGYAHARLPIDRFLKMASRKVLTINHVFEILLKFTETKSWAEAMQRVIPKRKGVALIQLDGDENNLRVSEEDPIFAMASNQNEEMNDVENGNTSVILVE